MSGLEQVTVSIEIPAGGKEGVDVTCPAGKKILGVAADWALSFEPTSARFASSLTHGRVYGHNTTVATDRLRGYATCAFVS